ncbi:histone acetyltransferase GCN5 [Sclerotinia borealis F-4128]|uniref:histone acetyltransferase n=1 Tax=Sclerotinia borealis (strain F-4128) TaxID=1432307 RepID=W9CQ10_SCLBF|nr:histone acetyltransferase GCN5 [Sclerotinia borealis F-4128]
MIPNTSRPFKAARGQIEAEKHACLPRRIADTQFRTTFEASQPLMSCIKSSNEETSIIAARELPRFWRQDQFCIHKRGATSRVHLLPNSKEEIHLAKVHFSAPGNIATEDSELPRTITEIGMSPYGVAVFASLEVYPLWEGAHLRERKKKDVFRGLACLYSIMCVVDTALDACLNYDDDDESLSRVWNPLGRYLAIAEDIGYQVDQECDQVSTTHLLTTQKINSSKNKFIPANMDATVKTETPVRMETPDRMDSAVEMETPVKMETPARMDNAAFKAEQNDEIEFRPVRNDRTEKNIITLAQYQQVVQEALPEMDPDYIARTVFDPTHTSLVMIQKNEGQIGVKSEREIGGIPQNVDEVIGGITYRVWKDRKFVEMIYLVVDTDQHGTGYGSCLMNHFKDEIKSSYAETIMEILAYADTTAIGFFKKHGFAKDVTLNKRVWGGIIKDYNQAALMQCTLLPRMRYVEAARMLRKQKECLLAILAASSRSDVVHAPPAQWSQGIVGPLDPYSIPGIRESGWSPTMDVLARETGSRPYSTPLRDFLSYLKRQKQVWPFLEPVDGDVITDYHKIIENPMDLQTMGEKLNDGLYETPKAFVEDVKLIISNCRIYNHQDSVFYRCSNVLERSMLIFIKAFVKLGFVEEWRNGGGYPGPLSNTFRNQELIVDEYFPGYYIGNLEALMQLVCVHSDIRSIWKPLNHRGYRKLAHLFAFERAYGGTTFRVAESVGWRLDEDRPSRL